MVKTSQNGSVNLRAQASSDSQRVTTLKTGQILTVLSEENGWAKVRTQDNQEGYVSAEYLIDKVTGTVVNICLLYTSGLFVRVRECFDVPRKSLMNLARGRSGRKKQALYEAGSPEEG